MNLREQIIDQKYQEKWNHREWIKGFMTIKEDIIYEETSLWLYNVSDYEYIDTIPYHICRIIRRVLTETYEEGELYKHPGFSCPQCIYSDITSCSCSECLYTLSHDGDCSRNIYSKIDNKLTVTYGCDLGVDVGDVLARDFELIDEFFEDTNIT